MFGYFPVGVIVFFAVMLKYFAVEKIGIIRYFPVPFLLRVLNLSKNTFCMEKKQCFDIIYFSRALFPF